MFMAESQAFLTFISYQVTIVKRKLRCILRSRFLTVDDIARDLGVAEDTVRGWIRKKKLPAYRIGKEYRIKVVDYEYFLEQSRTISDDFQNKD